MNSAHSNECFGMNFDKKNLFDSFPLSASIMQQLNKQYCHRLNFVTSPTLRAWICL